MTEYYPVESVSATVIGPCIVNMYYTEPVGDDTSEKLDQLMQALYIIGNKMDLVDEDKPEE